MEFVQGDHYEHVTVFDCYSSSVRDGGVRCKQIDLSDTDKWDLVLLDNVTEAQIKSYYNRTSGAKYDWWGALGIVLGIKQKRSKYFVQNGALTQFITAKKAGVLAQTNLQRWCIKME